ncbi:MAG TPA: phosphoribosylglycinamide formyltransferase [Gemmatimonadaceae bacterium]|jgi:formyltetrahydrofolate-dependent phosphoribosylglycinamide formyltransferase|nr:phosphoribosylglycinamide formyltransferase [Gemmatimonadaceae bacterium]
MSRARIAVLASGGGSNLQAILDHFTELGESRSGDVVLVASNNVDAGALRRAEAASITPAVLRSPRVPEGLTLEPLLREHDVDLVVLAGYMRLVPPEVTHAFRGRMLNVHPALLPAFGGPGMYGERVHRAVIAAGARESGPTVHFVDEVYDHGPVIAQLPVPVLPDDDAHALAARVLRAEHQLYPRVVDAVAGGRVRLLSDGRVDRGPFAEIRLATLDA